MSYPRALPPLRVVPRLQAQAQALELEAQARVQARVPVLSRALLRWCLSSSYPSWS